MPVKKSFKISEFQQSGGQVKKVHKTTTFLLVTCQIFANFKTFQWQTQQ